MTDMIERVARAMFDARWPGASWFEISPAEMAHFMNMARAAIAAMREPTIEMEVAGTEQWLCEAAMEDRARVNWRAMIDAALNP